MKKLIAVFRSLLHDVIGPDNKVLLFAWILAVTVILSLGFFLSSESVVVLGVAESREYQVNFDSAVEIKQVHVQPGQIVKKGDLLVELKQSEWASRLRELKKNLHRLQAESKLRSQISRLTRDRRNLPADVDPLQVDIQETEREISLVEHRMKNLFVLAEVDGAVGAVNFKNGEKAPAFAPLITLMPIHPTYVNGYINENLISNLQLNQTVEVSSQGGKSVRGVVVHIGSRIVPIPERLLRIRTLVAYGREVVVEIPAKNEFLLGEKVSVQKAWGWNLFDTAQADEKSEELMKLKGEPQDIVMSMGFSEGFSPELSGMIYLPDLRQFAVISDDYPGKTPRVLLMNEKGQLQEQMHEIEGLEKMDDIESISFKGQDIYLLSSLSPTKKGKLKEARQQFAKIRRNGLQFKLIKQINFAKVLLPALEKSKDLELNKIAQFKSEDPEKAFEIEGHDIRGDDLYLALKGPILRKNQGTILKVKNFESVFEKEALSPEAVSLAYRFQMSLPGKDAEMALSEMKFDDNSIWVASSCIEDNCSALWKVKESSDKAELVQEFKVKGLEGFARFGDTEKVYGVFDQNKKSQFVVFHNRIVQKVAK